jgi:hypothetical protein
MTAVLPEDLMLRALAGRPVSGTFEAHVTVAADGPAERDRFRSLCGALGVKPVLIELPAGESPSQPMTGSYHRGTVESAAREVAVLAHTLRAAGFAISRVKLEAVATNDGVPDTDTDAAGEPPGRYFEFHVKLLLPADAEMGWLEAACAAFGAKLSRNAFKQSTDGQSERFVTLRAYGVGRRTAFARLDALLASITAGGFNVVNKVREYSLFDSHVGLDSGWLDEPNGHETEEGQP